MPGGDEFGFVAVGVDEVGSVMVGPAGMRGRKG
jgi:hypothetical protein